jgi:hypothetical protein
MVSAFSSFSPEEAGLCASSGKSWHVSEEGQHVSERAQGCLRCMSANAAEAAWSE